ncbi:Protein MIZU-KUSSEI 1-like, plant [Dillenia turbinata]|uniref:Protein MIZU-KUSSEI 1-like, plant n=1 Tax=Dillenia turbinata TaxID=194707 RepID=A0AAN8V8W4_9MAGN
MSGVTRLESATAQQEAICTSKAKLMSYPNIHASNIIDGVTSIECQKQVHSWRLFRSLLTLLIPCCATTFEEENEVKKENHSFYNYFYSQPTAFIPNKVITGTIFGYRRGKVCFCIQTHSKSIPVLLLELAVPTTVLAREMKGGILRIVLKSISTSHANSNSLLSMPLWSMQCNGKKVGFAMKRKPTRDVIAAMQLMETVDVGAGTITGKELDRHDEIMYLRANFKRVSGSSESESFHLIDPEGCIGQELSIFFLRS